jgi:Spy/CpxP family protein refolding chaperone
MKPKLVAVIVIVMTFVIGGVAGVFVQRTFFNERGHGRGKLSDDLKKELQLTDDQQKQIDSVVARYRVQMQAQMEALRNRIRELLTPEQRRRHDEMLKKFDKRDEERRKKYN